MDFNGKVVCDHIVGNPTQPFGIASCPRCLKRGWYGGVSYDAGGRIDTVSQTQALKQSILKILTESRRPTGYGFDYNLLTGVIDASKLPAIKNEIIRCMDYLKYLQKQQENQGYVYPLNEKIHKIKTLIVEQSPNEPRKVEISFSVITKAGASFDNVLLLGR